MAWQPPQPPRQPGGAGPSSGGPGPAAGQSNQSQNLYQLLQVDSAAHPTIIRYAYRFLAGMYHPDNAESGNTEMFRIVSEAFRTLSDSGKRAAYDAKAGVKAPPPMQAGGQSVGTQGQGFHHLPKTGVSYSEVELRLAVLQVLLTARKKRPQTGGASAKMLMDVLHVEMAEMEFVLWYLREKGLIARTEQSFLITVPGVDYLVDSLSKTQVIDDGGKAPPANPLNLPATIGSS